MATRDVGDLGEDDFQRWCTLNKLLYTKSVRDRMGWDYLVEFKPPSDIRVGLDSQNEQKKALVQVKASDRKERSVVAKLSAFKQLVDVEMPSFIVAMHYDGSSAPQRVQLLHIGERQIEAILRKVRETESKGRTDLHTVKYRLSLSDAVALKVDGSDLGERLEACIGLRMADYLARKSAFRRTCGYSEAPFVGSAMLAPDVGLAQVADWQIGRLPHIRLEQATIHKVRFGVTLDKETRHLGAMLAKIEAKPAWKGVVTAISETHGVEADMVADIYQSDPLMGLDLWRLRFTNVFLDIYLPMQGQCEVKFVIEKERRYALNDLAQALKFGWLMSECGTRLKFSVGEREVGPGLPVHCTELAHFKDLYGFAECLSTALHQYRPHHSMDATVKEIEEALWANEKAYSVLSYPGFGFSFPIEGPADLAVASETSGVMIVPLCIMLKDIIYQSIVRIEASVSTDERAVHVMGGWPHVVDEGVALKRDAHGLGGKITKRAMLLRSRENGRGRMVLGFQDMVVGLVGDQDAPRGEISW